MRTGLNKDGEYEIHLTSEDEMCKMLALIDGASLELKRTFHSLAEELKACTL